MEQVKTYRLLDNERVETGKLYERETPWEKGEEDYYIVGVNNWIINSDGKFLVQKRALTKKNNPGKWSSTNGLVQLEETNYETVCRETYEELGIEINPDEVVLIKTNHIVGNHLIVDIFATFKDVKLDEIVIQESEVDKVSFVSLEEIKNMDFSTTCAYIKDLAPKMYEKYLQYKEQMEKET